MLFNSYEFIFGFLPATLIAYLLIGRASRGGALAWLILASVLFYVWWRPFNLVIVATSIVVNYGFGRLLLGLAGDEAKKGARTAVLVLGVAFNLGVLGWFKYANFAATVMNDVAGTRFVLEQIILPLGISFITFQKIAFLVDVSGGRIKSFTARDFVLFVMFFPQLIAGPIVHYRETLPQFLDPERKPGWDTIALGLTLFCFGLFKKVVFADGVARFVSPIYAYAAGGGDVTLLQAWQAAAGFTLQIYFDFSGYSDMACGAALMFGIRLPLNFDSPLKATNIIDFWLRWHVTLTRFLTAYVYNPITLAITRRRAAKKMPLLRGKGSKLSAFLVVLVGPTLFTMFLSGVWHGAGYTFVVWGLIHGGYLVINHAWRQWVARRPRAESGGEKGAEKTAGARVGAVVGFVLTFTAVCVAMVFFRAPDVAAAMSVLKGMVGLHGVGLPAALAELAPLPGVGVLMLGDGEVSLVEFVAGMGVVGILFLVALLAPNSLQILAAHKPVLDTPATPARIAGVGPVVAWSPSLPWMVVVALVGAVAVTMLSGESEFLYWQF